MRDEAMLDPRLFRVLAQAEEFDREDAAFALSGLEVEATPLRERFIISFRRQIWNTAAQEAWRAATETPKEVMPHRSGPATTNDARGSDNAPPQPAPSPAGAIDIVERLRSWADDPYPLWGPRQICREAADEIARLRSAPPLTNCPPNEAVGASWREQVFSDVRCILQTFKEDGPMESFSADDIDYLAKEVADCIPTPDWIRSASPINEEMVEQLAGALERQMFAPHELPVSMELHEKYRNAARAALAPGGK